MLLIYSQKITPRISYIFKTFFQDLVKCDYLITENKDEFVSHDGPKLNYSDHRLRDELFIESANLLFESTISPQNLEFKKYENYNVIFPTDDRTSMFPFDIFAASFYFLTRYEEYLILDRDSHGRFMPELSIAYQLSFLEEPVVNKWSNELICNIKRKYPEFEFIESQFQFISTIDIDRAYCYKLERPLKIIRHLLGTITKLRLNLFIKILLVRIGLIKDPYDTFSWLDELRQEYGIQMIFFVLLGNTHKLDINNKPDNKIFQELVIKLNKIYKLGIHPSYESNSDEEVLKDEIKLLEGLLRKRIEASRQHFLKLNLPDTYEKLINCGITEDYSMGYSTRLGFRASICSAYYYFNLKTNSETHLKIFPFPCMDGTFLYSLKYSPQEAIEKYIELIKKVKQVKGTFITIWHNSSLSGMDVWNGWNSVYREMVICAKKYC